MSYGTGLVLVVGAVGSLVQWIARRRAWSWRTDVLVSVPVVMGSALIYALIHVWLNHETIDFG